MRFIHSRHVDALESRIRELEQTNSGRHALDHTQGPLTNHEAQRYDSSPIGLTRSFSTLSHPFQEVHDTSPGQNTVQVKSDAHNSPQTFPTTDSRRRYGKSSSLHFALHVKASATAMEDEEPKGTTNGAAFRLSSYEHETQGDSSQPDDPEDVDEADDDNDDCMASETRPHLPMSQLLPHRHLANILFAKYFEAVHPIWPFLLEGETRELFNLTWRSEEPPEPLWLVQLNLILCLGCRHYDEAENGHTFSSFDAANSGQDFYRRAKEYVQANAFTTSSIGMLQALLLMALYQQGVMQFNQFYLTIGHAARMAQSLGFHISRPENENILPQHRELRRRLWWGCFCLDRYVNQIISF